MKASCLSRLDSMKSVRDVDDMYELDIYSILLTYLCDHLRKKHIAN